MNKVLHSLSIRYLYRPSICLSTLALILGGMIYVLFRTAEPLFFQYIRALGFGNELDFIRQYAFTHYIKFPAWIIYSLPSGLWAFAYAMVITSIWSGSKSKLKYFWIISIPMLVLGYEILQYPGIIPGTFCLYDLAFDTAGLLFGVIIGIKSTKLNNHEKASE